MFGEIACFGCSDISDLRMTSIGRLFRTAAIYSSRIAEGKHQLVLYLE